jgi:pyruvate/2-oxoglutarate dehydrogenase complex dihydrolipoamide acyltransferase (E2) component
MGRVQFRKDYHPPVFRKIAYGTWQTVGDPSVYAQIDLDMSAAQKFVEQYSTQHNVKITPMHLVAYAITHCMRKRPEINGMLRRGRVYLREHVALFFQVNVPGTGEDKTKGASLSGTTLDRVEDMSLADIARALRDRATKIRDGKDVQFNKSLNTIKSIPWRGVRHFLNFVSWLTYEMNLDLSALGIPRDPFGSAMITNIGSMGIDVAWAPLCPYTRVPLLMAIGAVSDRPVAINGKVEVRPMMSIGVTFDHRMMDGVHAAEMSREFKKVMSEPEKYIR